MSRITVEQLYASYGVYLRAKVQLVEMQNWGPTTTDSFRNDIDQHAELEAAYVQQMLADRRVRTEEFKAQLEAIDRAEKGRRR